MLRRKCLLIGLVLSSCMLGACANGGGGAGQIDPATRAALLLQFQQQNKPYVIPMPQQSPPNRNVTTNCHWLSPQQMTCNSF